ncbi:hypothetical protein E1281_14640 [Actinomadura sp. KC345]|uniref:hypothetical protein n=1 Tax=Actinomadura sp. KC345 TaxID=2530371 RepID=UPI001051B746|nr:hypothetical protein [Actinomadura sp. KC345]TDC55050.1 hypothetical protein E1281_14640 [Actinomadura sp. KC345]
MGMRFGGHADTAERPAPSNERRVHLDALRDAVQARQELACGMVERRGVTWVSVVGVGGTRRLVEVGCDYGRSTWWFTWSDGRPIVPARDVHRAVDVLIRELAGT